MNLNNIIEQETLILLKIRNVRKNNFGFHNVEKILNKLID